MRIPVYRTSGQPALVGATDEAARVIERMRPGDEFYIDIDRPRNYRQLKGYWALCELVASNHETLRTKEQVDFALRVLAGHCEPLLDPRTRKVVALVPKRLRYRDMDQTEWEQYYRRAKDAVLEHILPGLTSAVLEEEIAQMASR